MLERIFLKDGRLRPVLRVLAYIAAVLAAQIVLSLPVVIGYRFFFGPQTLGARPPAWLGEFIGAIAVVGTAIVLRFFLDRHSIASLGVSFRTRWLKLFVIGILFGAGLQLVVFAVELALGYEHVLEISASAMVWRALLGWTVLFLIAALAEEMPLRGYILQNLWEEFGFWPAAIVTSLFFALLHANNPNFGELPWLTVLNIAVDGMWACLAVLWTRSLWLAWGAHFAWNLFEGPVLGLPVSGIHTGAALVEQVVTGPPVVTGDKFGPEAGIVVFVVQLIGIGALYALHRAGAFAGLPDTREAYAREAPAAQT